MQRSMHFAMRGAFEQITVQDAINTAGITRRPIAIAPESAGPRGMRLVKVNLIPTAAAAFTNAVYYTFEVERVSGATVQDEDPETAGTQPLPRTQWAKFPARGWREGGDIFC